MNNKILVTLAASVLAGNLALASSVSSTTLDFSAPAVSGDPSPTENPVGSIIFNLSTQSFRGLFDDGTWKPLGSTSAPSVATKTLWSGSGTYTTPAGVSYLKIKMIGGGGGGSGSSVSTSANGGVGGTGSTTTFGTSLLTANGGLGGDGSAVGAGGAGGIYAAAGVAAASNTGAGGSGGGCTSSCLVGNGGGAGGYIEAVISSPNSSYTYSVGAGGAGGTPGTGGINGGAGGSGVIFIEEHYQ